MQEDARTRGVFIHRCLHILCGDNSSDNNDPTLLKRVSGELGIHHQGGQTDPSMMNWLKEARAVINHPEFSNLFESNQYLSAYNEVPIQYTQGKNEGEQMVYGIIDRVVITENEVFVIDYKTHRLTVPDKINEIGEYYRAQINLYCQGAKLLWPEKNIRGLLLLTHKLQLVPIQT